MALIESCYLTQIFGLFRLYMVDVDGTVSSCYLPEIVERNGGRIWAESSLAGARRSYLTGRRRQTNLQRRVTQ